MTNPYDVVKQFEAEVGLYTGAPYVVAVSSCTMALTLAVAWHKVHRPWSFSGYQDDDPHWPNGMRVQIPTRTYVSVPMAIIHAGARPTFRDYSWSGSYRLDPLPVWDSARHFSSGMYCDGTYLLRVRNGEADRVRGHWLCVSFQASKILGDTQGGAILHDSPEADKWMRRARFDGRTAGVAPKDDTFPIIGWHCYMSPDVAARLLLKLYSLPQHNDPLPNDEYPDLSQMEIFK